MNNRIQERLSTARILCALAVSLGASVSAALAAPIDETIPYQGRLLESGTPVTGIRPMDFCIYDGPDPSTDLQLACDFQGGVGIQDGVFNTRLDFGAINLDQALWLQVSVDDGGIMTPLEPLSPLGASPQAAYAIDAGSLQGFQAADFALAGHSHTPEAAGAGLLLIGDTYSVEVDGQTVDFDGNALAVQAGKGLKTTASGVEADPDGVTIGFNAQNRLTVLGGGGGSAGYDGLAVVSAVNGDYPDPIAAMNDRSTWCDQSGGSKRCLMFIQPGTYELNGILFLRPGIAVVGAQEDRVALTRTTTDSSNIVVNGDFCTGDCFMAHLSVQGTVEGTGTLTAVDIGSGFAELRHVTISATGGEDPAFGLMASGNQVTAHDVIVSATGSAEVFPLRVASGADLQLNDCVVLGHSFGSTSAGIFIVNGSARTSNCEFRLDRNSNFSSSTQGIFIFNGSYSDSDSRFKLGSAGTANGIQGESCTSRLELDGTRFDVDGTSGADGLNLTACSILARNVQVTSSTASGAGIRMEDGALELRHSAVDVAGDGVVGTATGALSLQGLIRHSVIEAGGSTLVDFDQGLRLFFTDLRGTGTISALTCRAVTAGPSFTFFPSACP